MAILVGFVHVRFLFFCSLSLVDAYVLMYVLLRYEAQTRGEEKKRTLVTKMGPLTRSAIYY